MGSIGRAASLPLSAHKSPSSPPVLSVLPLSPALGAQERSPQPTPPADSLSLAEEVSSGYREEKGEEGRRQERRGMESRRRRRRGRGEGGEREGKGRGMGRRRRMEVRDNE